MEGPPISDNILLLSADMENLAGLSQQTAVVSNTENGRFKYLVSTLSALYSSRYRTALVCFVQLSL